MKIAEQLVSMHGTMRDELEALRRSAAKDREARAAAEAAAAEARVAVVAARESEAAAKDVGLKLQAELEAVRKQVRARSRATRAAARLRAGFIAQELVHRVACMACACLHAAHPHAVFARVRAPPTIPGGVVSRARTAVNAWPHSPPHPPPPHRSSY